MEGICDCLDYDIKLNNSIKFLNLDNVYRWYKIRMVTSLAQTGTCLMATWRTHLWYVKHGNEDHLWHFTTQSTSVYDHMTWDWFAVLLTIGEFHLFHNVELMHVNGTINIIEAKSRQGGVGQLKLLAVSTLDDQYSRWWQTGAPEIQIYQYTWSLTYDCNSR